MILSLSFKNIWRNKVRSLVVIMSMCVGLTGGIMAVAMMQGMVDQKIESTIYTELSHIQIHQTEFISNPEVLAFIPNADSIAEFVKSDANVLAVSRRLKTPVMINSARVSTGVNLIGIDPTDEKTVSELYSKVCDSCGTYLDAENSNRIFISARLAKRLKIKLRSKVVVTMQDTAGNLTGGSFRVCGIYKTFNAGFDEGNAYVLNSDFRRLTLLPENVSHEISVLLKNNESLNDVRDNIEAKFPGQTTRTWKTIQPENAMLSEWMAVMNYFIVGIILLTLGFGILNTMLMAVLDRVKEIGMLMTIGMAKAKVFKTIMLETIMLSLIGGSSGVVVSLFVLQLFKTNGFDFSMYSDAFDRLGYPSVIYPTIPADFFVGLTILVLLTGIISAIYPARKAIKLKPIEALRTDT